MKWFTSLESKFMEVFFKTLPAENLVYLKKGEELYCLNKFGEALHYLDNAADFGFDAAVYQLRAKCFQNLNSHYNAIEDFDKVIEDNPFDFSNYYSRAVSKKAIFDISGQIEDLQNCIHYSRKNKKIENLILKKIENDLIETRNYIENFRNFKGLILNKVHLEIHNHIRECLNQIKKIRTDTKINKLNINRTSSLKT